MNSPAPVHSRAARERRFGPACRWRVLATVMTGTVASIMPSTIVVAVFMRPAAPREAAPNAAR